MRDHFVSIVILNWNAQQSVTFWRVFLRSTGRIFVTLVRIEVTLDLVPSFLEQV